MPRESSVKEAKSLAAMKLVSPIVKSIELYIELSSVELRVEYQDTAVEIFKWND